MYWDWHGWPIGAFRTSLCLCAFSKNVLPPVTAPVCLDIHPPPSQGLRRPTVSWQQDVISHLLWLFSTTPKWHDFFPPVFLYGATKSLYSPCVNAVAPGDIWHICVIFQFFFYPSSFPRNSTTRHTSCAAYFKSTGSQRFAAGDTILTSQKFYFPAPTPKFLYAAFS